MKRVKKHVRSTIVRVRLIPSSRVQNPSIQSDVPVSLIFRDIQSVIKFFLKNWQEVCISRPDTPPVPNADYDSVLFN